MTLERRSGLNHQISEEAAEWLVEFRTGDIDAAGRRDFDAWMRASPEHLRAFVEMAALWVDSASIDAQRRLDVDAIITRARSEENIVGLRSSPAYGEGTTSSLAAQPDVPRGGAGQIGQEAPRSRRHTRTVTRALAASLVLVILGAGLLLTSIFLGTPTYGTGVGQQRSIELSDGSTVVLDSRSRLRVDFTATTRQVELLQGQALFRVTRNPQRPFVVRAGGAVIRDVGTQFDVNRNSGGTIVTVMEGQVAVSTRAATVQSRVSDQAPRVSLLGAGDQIDVLAGELSPRLTRVNVSSVTAWTHGRVVLESATLKQVAEAFDPYSRRRLVTEDRGSLPLRLSGVFATNPDFLIRYLRERPDIAVTETDSEIDIVRNGTK